VKWYGFLLQGVLVASLVWFVWRVVSLFRGAQHVAAEEKARDAALRSHQFQDRLQRVLEKHSLTGDEWQQHLASRKITASAKSLDMEIAEAARLFNVSSEWLDHTDGDVYPQTDLYNAPEAVRSFLDLLAKGEGPQLWVFKPAGVAVTVQAYEAFLLLVGVTQGRMGDRVYSRMGPVHVYWEWGFPPTRQQCTALLQMAVELGIPLIGYEAAAVDLNKILDNQFLLQEFLSGDLQPTWNPSESLLD